MELDNITTTSGYSQMLEKPIHFVNGSPSCIDLIFPLMQVLEKTVKFNSYSLKSVSITSSMDP